MNSTIATRISLRIHCLSRRILYLAKTPSRALKKSRPTTTCAAELTKKKLSLDHNEHNTTIIELGTCAFVLGEFTDSGYYTH
jgi:hypothetical protein